MAEKKKNSIEPKAEKTTALGSEKLLGDIRLLIEQTRSAVAQTVNSTLVLMNWHIGKLINNEILNNKRAEYGKEILPTLSAKLTEEYGRGFTTSNLLHFVRFAQVFPDEAILYALSRELSWTHFRQLIYIEDALKRDFYTEMCRIENWNTRSLADKINGMLFERTAISRKSEEVIKAEIAELRDEDKLTPNLVFRDTYFLDFLGLKDTFSEKDLESAILRELENFLLELGLGFTFVARQKRITIDGEDFHLDLLLFHRDLRRLVVIELKLGKFKAAYSGQTELYLQWLNKYERKPWEESPIGLILCSEKSKETVELLALDERNIKVADYWTKLPNKKLLEQKLHNAVRLAREQIGKTRGGKEDT